MCIYIYILFSYADITVTYYIDTVRYPSALVHSSLSHPKGGSGKGDPENRLLSSD